jgi:endonuclease VIII
MPEGDSVHRIAGRLEAALGGRELERAEAPSPRSPLHGRVEALLGRRLDRAEARGKHLLAHFSDDLVLHSHLGMNGRWRFFSGGRSPRGSLWLLLGAEFAAATQTGGRLLRLVSESRLHRDPALSRLGPDPLGEGFDPGEASRRLRELGAGRAVGEALLDQRIIAGVGNAIRNEACFGARVSPWRGVDELGDRQAERLIGEVERTMRTSLERGRRPQAIYGATRTGCPGCGAPVSSRGQGDANRTAYWCARCQP